MVCRVPNTSIAAFGRWALDIMTTSYLQGIPMDALLASAGVPVGGDQMSSYWAERFMVEVLPEDLALLKTVLFPFLDELQLRVAEVNIATLQHWCMVERACPKLTLPHAYA
jgi:hypothetical protein